MRNIPNEKDKECKTQLTIFVAPLDAIGHVNACSGLARSLQQRGHRIVFFVDQSFQGKLLRFGFEEYYYDSYPHYTNKNENTIKPGQKLADLLFQYKVLGPYSPRKKLQNMIKMMFADSHKFLHRNKCLKEAIDTIKPDLIIVDNICLMPAIAYSSIPWIKNISMTPIFYVDDNDLPPAGSGYPSHGSRELWSCFRNKDCKSALIYSEKFNDLIEQMGYEKYEDNRMMPDSQILTVHAYPEELNYPQIRRKGWFNLEVFNKNATKETVNLKELVGGEFLNDTLDGRFSGKLIYVSMGSIGTVDLNLMRRLVEALGKTHHKYIVSMGARHAEYSLAHNMWGDAYLPQTKLIPLVDLVITHGGNNTVTESFAQGKPMLVMPLFGDQYDNAQRLQEMGFGLRLDPYTFADKEIAVAIEQLLYDEQLAVTLQKAAERIQATDTHGQLCDMIAQLFTQ